LQRTRFLDEAGRDRRDRKYVIDQVAAVVILRGWMEAGEQAAALGQRDLRKTFA